MNHRDGTFQRIEIDDDLMEKKETVLSTMMSRTELTTTTTRPEPYSSVCASEYCCSQVRHRSRILPS